MLLLWKILIAVNVASMFVDCQFENQYLGHNFTFDEYNKQELACETRICLLDAQIILLAATQNHTIEPCDDFEEFAMGQFKKLGALNDRYQIIGFHHDVQSLYLERIRKLVAAKVNEKDIRPFRIAKNYYQKCVNSDNIRTNATAEMLQYLRSLGGAPFVDSSWNEENFKIEALFEKVAHHATLLFLNHGILTHPHPRNYSQKVVFLQFVDHDFFSAVGVDDFVQMYKVLKIDENLVRSAEQKGQAFRLSQRNLTVIGDNYRFFTISSFNEYTNYKLNWLKIFNSQFTKEAQLTDDSEILIEKPELILKLLELISLTPKETLADYFVYLYTYELKDQFIVYSFDKYQQSIKSTIISEQRWEQCVVHLRKYFGPAIHGLYKLKHFNKEVQDSVHNLTKDVIKDLITLVTKAHISDYAKQDVVQKLNTAKFQIGYPEEIFDIQKIEEFYNDLELDETEGVINSSLKIKNYHDKINNNPKSSWKKKLNDKQSQFAIEYDTDENIIYIHQMFIKYPFYHPNRSRFFNTATLFKLMATYLNRSVREYLKKNWYSDIEDIDFDTFAYNNYVNWEKSGGKDLRLPGFFLTNQQMYWVAVAHTTYAKFHPHNKKAAMLYEHFNQNFKDTKSFRKAFNCSELARDEQLEMLLKYFRLF